MLAVISDTEDTNRPALLAIIKLATRAAKAGQMDGGGWEGGAPKTTAVCNTHSLLTARCDRELDVRHGRAGAFQPQPARRFRRDTPAAGPSAHAAREEAAAPRSWNAAEVTWWAAAPGLATSTDRNAK